MKHTLNVLTLTALAAAASAQTAPAASGLNYNTIGFSRTSTQNAVTVQAALGTSGFVAGLQSTGSGTATTNSSITLGYVFKGVTQGIDANVFVQQTQGEQTAYGVTLRRALSEVYAGLEISASYAGTLESANGSVYAIGGTTATGTSANNVELSYNVNKTVSVAVGLTKGNQDAKRQTVVSVRAGF